MEIGGYPWWMIVLKLFVLGGLAWGAWQGFRRMRDEKRKKAEDAQDAFAAADKGTDEQ